MDGNYDVDDPQAWVGKRAWRDVVGRGPTSKVPSHTQETWGESFTDRYPDGRSHVLYCLPRSAVSPEASPPDSGLAQRLESLEGWHRHVQDTLGELGRALRDHAEESRATDQAVASLLDLLEKRTDHRGHVADRLIAFSMDEPGGLITPSDGQNDRGRP